MGWHRFTLHQRRSPDEDERAVGEAFADGPWLYPRGAVRQRWFLYDAVSGDAHGAYTQPGAKHPDVTLRVEYAGEAPSFDARKHRDTLRARGTAFRMADVSSTGSIVGPITLPPLRFAPELDPGHIYTLFVFVPGSGAEREVGAVVVPKLAAPDVVELWHLREGGSPAQDFISPSPESPSVALRLVAARSIDAQFDVKTFTPPFASRCLVLAGTETRYG